MSKLKELIDRLCPDGVEFKSLSAVMLPLKKGTLKISDLIENGKYPVINSGRELYGYYDQFNNEAPAITIAARGEYAGWVSFFEERFWAGGLCYPYKSKDEAKVATKFIYYWLKNQERDIMDNLVARGSIPALNKADIDKYSIPIPPIEVQEEIVKILDRFADYAAELQAELQARKEQYEYYRNLLLTFNPSACGCGTDGEQEIKVTTWGGHSYETAWKTMGEIGKFIRGNGLQKKDFTDSGVGCIHYGQIYTHYGTFATETKSFVSPTLADKLLPIYPDNLVIACTSENVEDVGKAVAWLGDKNIVTGGHSVVFRHNQNPKYIAYYFQTQCFFAQKKKYAYGAKVIDIRTDDLAKVRIPIPPIELQEKIVAILDRFETLVNDLTQGLPAEIAAVKELYEYYRNKLLTFKQIA